MNSINIFKRACVDFLTDILSNRTSNDNRYIANRPQPMSDEQRKAMFAGGGGGGGGGGRSIVRGGRGGRGGGGGGGRGGGGGGRNSGTQLYERPEVAGNGQHRINGTTMRLPDLVRAGDQPMTPFTQWLLREQPPGGDRNWMPPNTPNLLGLLTQKYNNEFNTASGGYYSTTGSSGPARPGERLVGPAEYDNYQGQRSRGRQWGESRPGEMYPAVEGPGNPSWEARNPGLNPNPSNPRPGSLPAPRIPIDGGGVVMGPNGPVFSDGTPVPGPQAKPAVMPRDNGIVHTGGSPNFDERTGTYKTPPDNSPVPFSTEWQYQHLAKLNQGTPAGDYFARLAQRQPLRGSTGGRAWGESRPGEKYPDVEGPGNPSWERRNPYRNPRPIPVKGSIDQGRSPIRVQPGAPAGSDRVNTKPIPIRPITNIKPVKPNPYKKPVPVRPNVPR